MKPWIDYIWTWVWAIVLNEQWKVLVNQRWPEAHNEVGLWEFPGGTVEFWDSLDVTVVREVKEETWIDIVVERFLWTFDHILSDEGQHWINSVYLTKYVGWDISIPKGEEQKILHPQWMSLEDVENLDLTQASKDTLRAYYEVFPQL